MNANYVHVIIKHPGYTTQAFKTKLQDSNIDIGDAKLVENYNDNESTFVHGYQDLIDVIDSKITGITIVTSETKGRSKTPVKARSSRGGNKSKKYKKSKSKISKSKKRI